MTDNRLTNTTRFIQISMVAAIALFFSIVAFDNISDFQPLSNIAHTIL